MPLVVGQYLNRSCEIVQLTPDFLDFRFVLARDFTPASASGRNNQAAFSTYHAVSKSANMARVSILRACLKTTRGCCFPAKGRMARRDEGDCFARQRTFPFGNLNRRAWKAPYPSWIFD
jgi:hypothetical protein